MIRFGSCKVRRMNRAKDTFWVPDGVLGHAEIPRDINKSKMRTMFRPPKGPGTKK